MDSSQAKPASLPPPTETIQPTHKSGRYHLIDLGTGKLTFFAILFYLLLNSMTIKQKTVVTESKQLNNNADIQKGLNLKNGVINFEQPPEGAKSATVHRVMAHNEEISTIKEQLENRLITVRQGAQIQMTETSTNVNLLEQDTSEDSGWIKTLNTTFKVIDGITKNSI